MTSYDPTERRPSVEEIREALNAPRDAQKEYSSPPHLKLPYYTQQEYWSETTLYFQSLDESYHKLDRVTSEYDKEWILSVIVDILQNVYTLGGFHLATLAYSDISRDTWRPSPNFTIVIKTENVNLDLNENSVIDYGWKLDLMPNDHFSHAIIQILRLNARYVILFEQSEIS